MNPTNQRLLSPDDSLLVIIDMQERLLPVITGKEGVVENVIRLVKFSHIIGLPAILTEQEKLGNTIPEIRTAPRAACHVNPIVKTTV